MNVLAGGRAGLCLRAVVVAAVVLVVVLPPPQFSSPDPES